MGFFLTLKHSTLDIYCGGIRICNGWICGDLMSILTHILISPTNYKMWSLFIIHISLPTKITHPYEPFKSWQSTKTGINQKFQWFHRIYNYIYNFFNTQTDKYGIMCFKNWKKKHDNERWTFVCCICAWNLQLTMNCPADIILIKKIIE